ncbi:cell growth-regulating nucleolar protein [Gouania willdenowi]|uniref:Zinc finger C2H2 LYAR-type domain-containing protein n=1 Tax=Gouania willdenowi TaxID=441366 RepID=A0A8C5D7H0_GOUWI|nr:cell growth-regulating nucleolar protein [Gouania willdenowi]
MVFFTCNACGESLKKAQVEKHVNMCRGCQVLSCIDCGKDFWGEDYKNHNKCISEDQKYGGKGYEAKANKGDVKQQQWMQKIHEAMNRPGISSRLKDVLSQLSAYENVPRKKGKFQNWMRNSLKIVNPQLQEEVWDIFAAADNAPKAPVETESVQINSNVKSDPDGTMTDEQKKKKLNKRERKEARQQKNGKAVKVVDAPKAEEEEEKSVKRQRKEKKRKNGEDAGNNVSKKKRKVVEEADDVIDEGVSDKDDDEPKISKGKFNWKGNIKAVLREAPEKELPLKKLRKKVLAAYYTFTGDNGIKTEHEVLALFTKKINGNPKFRVLKERVKLLQ